MKFKYEVDIEKLAIAKEELDRMHKDGPKAVFELFIANMISVKYPEGIKGRAVRTLDRILTKVDDSKDGTIDIEEVETDFLMDVLNDENLLVGPRQVRLLATVRRNLLQAVGKAE